MSVATNPHADGLLFKLLFMPEGRQDPYPIYREIRETAPIFKSQIGPIVMSRYDDCLDVLRNPRLGRGTQARARGELPMPEDAGFRGSQDEARRDAFFSMAIKTMLFLDPPDHTRLRRLVSRAFTPQRVDAMRPKVQAMVDAILDRMERAGEVDVMEALALPLPMSVIGELLGVPEADRPRFQPLVRRATKLLEPTVDNDSFDDGWAAQEEMGEYFQDLVEERRRHPTDDLLAGLVHARDEGDALDDQEVIATALLLFGAGFETTTNLIGNGLYALLTHPDQIERWEGKPGTEELLRWDSPVQVNGRTALEATDLANGLRLERGDFVMTLLGGANRDPSRFPEPETLDVLRPDNGPISFGSGIHHCLGAALARMEGDVVFTSLFRRFSKIELTVPPESIEYRPTLTLRGLASLPVRVAA